MYQITNKFVSMAILWVKNWSEAGRPKLGVGRIISNNYTPIQKAYFSTFNFI